MATLVKFLKDQDGEILAYFPQLNYNKQLYGNSMKTGYARIGRHTSVHKEYAAECKAAAPAEYANLNRELTNIGYTLKILKP